MSLSNSSGLMVHSFHGAPIEQRPKDGYVNATSMTKAYLARSGKRRDVSEWLSNTRTKETLRHLSAVTGIPVTELYQVIQGGEPTLQGTWIHPRLAVRFGMWLDDEFGFAVETWVEAWTTGNLIQPVKTPHVITPYSDRIAMLKTSVEVPKDHWIVAQKVAHLMLDVERAGYSVNKFDLIDGSIGRKWSGYREGQKWTVSHDWGVYKFNDKRGDRPVKAYHNDELGKFDSWLQQEYEPNIMPEYLKGKYGAMVKA